MRRDTGTNQFFATLISYAERSPASSANIKGAGAVAATSLSIFGDHTEDQYFPVTLVSTFQLQYSLPINA
jgi:hypothetical protein